MTNAMNLPRLHRQNELRSGLRSGGPHHCGPGEGIVDIITFHAETVKEFERHFHEVVDAYIAACEQLGGEPEKPASGILMLRIDPNLHAPTLKIPHRQGLSLNKWAEQALRAATQSRMEDR